MNTLKSKSQVLNSEKTVIESILDVNNLTLTEFAILLFGHQIEPKSALKRLLKYRKGEREFRLDMAQIKIINQLLKPLQVSITDLPDDWILDKS